MGKVVGYVLPVIQYSLSVSFHHCSTFIFVFKPLLSEQPVTEDWTFKSSSAIPEMGELEGKYLMLFFIFKDSTVTKAASRWPVTTASRIRAWICLRVNRGE